MWFRVLLSCLTLTLLSSCLALPPQFPPSQPPVARDTGDNLFREAEKYYRNQDYRRAWQKYSAYLQQQPQGPRASQARLRQAELLGLLRDWQGSLRQYQAILNRGAEGDTALQARYGIGRAYFKLGRYQQAAEVLESLTASELPGPLRFSTNALLAEVALKKGEVEPAFVRLRLASRDLAAGDQEWFNDLETRLVEQATPAELEHLASLYRDSPLTAPLLWRLAGLAREQGRPAEARKWLMLLKERFPESKEVRMKEASLDSTKTVLGCLLPLSGRLAAYGNRVKQGMELAAKGTSLELVYRDCPNKPDTATRMVQELAQDARVLALLGPLTSADAKASSQAAQAAGIPLLALSQKQDLTSAGPMVFQIFLTPQLQVRALLRYTLGQRGLNRYAVFFPESTYGRILAQLFGKELVAQGGVLVGQESYAPGSTDFTLSIGPLLATYRAGGEVASSFEALFIPDDVSTVAAIATQVAKDPLRQAQFLGTNLAKPGAAQEKEAQALNGILFPVAFFGGDPNPAVQSFIAAYRQRYGTVPDYLAAQGYMVVRLMAHLIETQGTVTRAELPQKLLSLREIPNLPWFKGFASNRQADLALYVLTIKNGRVEMVISPGAGQP